MYIPKDLKNPIMRLSIPPIILIQGTSFSKHDGVTGSRFILPCPLQQLEKWMKHMRQHLLDTGQEAAQDSLTEGNRWAEPHNCTSFLGLGMHNRGAQAVQGSPVRWSPRTQEFEKLRNLNTAGPQKGGRSLRDLWKSAQMPLWVWYWTISHTCTLHCGTLGGQAKNHPRTVS